VKNRFDEIQTSRLLMRRWREADRAPFAALNADAEVMRHFPEPLSRSLSDAMVDRITARFEDQGFGLWALEVRATGQFIGFTGLHPMPEGIPGAGGMEVGWRLARQAWHQGYATEAARAAVDLAFGPLGLPELWSQTAVTNEASQAVMKRLGMTHHAFFDHQTLPAGHPAHPQVVFHLAGDGPSVQRDGPVHLPYGDLGVSSGRARSAPSATRRRG
jgi:RimJ/RimL family protein N-acetyltransferase